MNKVKALNLEEELQSVDEYFYPKVVGEVNDVYVKVAKIKGDKIPWHNHKNEDEMFFILRGNLTFEVEGQPSFIMNEGDIFIVRKGVNHRVSSDDECHIMLIENKTTKHTGDVESEITRDIEQQLNQS